MIYGVIENIHLGFLDQLIRCDPLYVVIVLESQVLHMMLFLF